ncbi:DNA-directed RNA polymerase subunit A' [Candidatus Woesearchaeota archaeon]|nr:DNA-directed RNA polymerase subunit A' [Candidatus Woesearchaeota archaeon]
MEDYVHKKIESIVFGIFSPKMVKKMASAKIVTPELYDKEGYPVDGGLMDIRLGVIDPGLKCKTCGSKLKECIGHFGYIELARPVIHIKFVDIILNLLRCTCKECGRILIPKNKIDKNAETLEQIDEEYGPEARRSKIKEIIASMKTINKCPYCKARQQKITLEKPTIFLENEKRITPIEIRSRLEKIPDEDLPVFGINPQMMRPEWVVLTVLPIPPVTMRPSITLESGERSEDDLTHKLGDIVRINQRLFENINAGAPEIIIEDLWDLLQYHVTTFFDNNVPQLPPARHRSGQPLKGLTERIKSKEGRIRHNLAGKRTNFSARTVISPDPRIKLNEVGIPKSVAMKLTVPEVVNTWNMQYLKGFIERGPAAYPGSNYIVRPDGRKKKITDETKEQLLEELQPGFVVERHLMDGDVCIFNRQPSLHRMSMMCHRARILPYKTFRLNPLVCTPYNADFDGDEMNLHVPQTEEARAEAEILMEVQTQLISPRFGLSIIGCTQDAISGNYLLTQDWFEVPKWKAVRMLANAGVDDFSKLPDKKMVSGKEIFSVILPDDFNYTGYTKKFKPGMEDKISKKDRGNYYVTIRKGQLIEGVMDKANLGEGQGLLLRNLHKRYGQDRMVEYIGKIFKLGIEVLFELGFTCSISDSDVSKEAAQKIEETREEAFGKVDEFIRSFYDGTLEPFPGKSISDTLELKILEVLNKARNTTGRLVSEYTTKHTGSLVMSESGAKGSPLNMAQMAACVGQQALRGSRINRGYTGRTLPSFRKDDLGPDAHGFIKKGFRDGLKPHEFFFQAMTGRDSLMDTALRTPKSGYLYRRLANALQDLKVEYDDTVREASNRIIQFRYGEDSMDVSKSEGGKINVKKIVEQEMEGA